MSFPSATSLTARRRWAGHCAWRLYERHRHRAGAAWTIFPAAATRDVARDRHRDREHPYERVRSDVIGLLFAIGGDTAGALSFREPGRTSKVQWRPVEATLAGQNLPMHSPQPITSALATKPLKKPSLKFEPVKPAPLGGLLL
jgi:hypothetical protein